MTQEGKNKAFKIVDISTYLNTNKYFLKMILGKVHACGEGTNGRLGLSHSSNVSAPRQMSALSQYVVKKVAVHSGGKHAMALTVDGKVFSWVSKFLRFFLYYFEIFYQLSFVWRGQVLQKFYSFFAYISCTVSFLKGFCAFICLSSGCVPFLPIDGAAIAFC